MQLPVSAIFSKTGSFVPLSALAMTAAPKALDALIVAVPETAGSALYGMLDVLAAAGTLWPVLVKSGPPRRLIAPRIVSTSGSRSAAATAYPWRRR